MSRSLAFFGAFNPPTRAHIDLAEYAMKVSGRDEVIFVPSKSTYIMEDQKKNFAFSDSSRIEMLDVIAANRPWMRWTDIEMHQAVQPRTYLTLCMLRDQGESPSLLMGADKLIELETEWQNIPEIAEEFGIVCMDRGNLDCGKIIAESPFLQSLHLNVIKVPEQYKNFSSSRARECLFNLTQLRDELRELLPPELGMIPVDLMRQ